MHLHRKACEGVTEAFELDPAERGRVLLLIALPRWLRNLSQHRRQGPGDQGTTAVTENTVLVS